MAGGKIWLLVICVSVWTSFSLRFNDVIHSISYLSLCFIVSAISAFLCVGCAEVSFKKFARLSLFKSVFVCFAKHRTCLSVFFPRLLMDIIPLMLLFNSPTHYSSRLILPRYRWSYPLLVRNKMIQSLPHQLLQFLFMSHLFWPPCWVYHSSMPPCVPSVEDLKVKLEKLDVDTIQNQLVVRQQELLNCAQQGSSSSSSSTNSSSSSFQPSVSSTSSSASWSSSTSSSSRMVSACVSFFSWIETMISQSFAPPIAKAKVSIKCSQPSRFDWLACSLWCWSERRRWSIEARIIWFAYGGSWHL